MKTLLFCAALALSGLQAQAATKTTASADTLVVQPTPAMHCNNCEKKIKQNIRFVKGTKKIATSVQNQTVTIIYDNSKATYNDFVAAFKKIGYSIQKVNKK